jgi:hypothetical protein
MCAFKIVEEPRLFYNLGTDFSKLLSGVLKIQEYIRTATPHLLIYAVTAAWALKIPE